MNTLAEIKRAIAQLDAAIALCWQPNFLPLRSQPLTTRIYWPRSPEDWRT